MFRNSSLAIILILTLTLSAAPAEMNLQDLREKAGDSLAQGRLPEATELYRLWTEREPRRLEAFLGYGRSLLAMGYTERARGIFLRAEQLRSDSMEAKIGIAESYLVGGQAAQAYELLDSVRKKDPSNIQLNLAMASYYRMMGRNDLRRGFLEKALRQDPASLDAILGLAVLAAEEGKISESETRLERAALVSPDALSLIKKRAEIHYTLSFGKYGRPQLEKARRYYRMYLHSAGDDPSVLGDLIHIEYLLGHADEAKKLAERLDAGDLQRRPILHANIAEAIIERSPGAINELTGSLQVACERAIMPLSCFRLEETLLQYDRNRSLQPMRLRSMKARLKEARRRTARNRADAEEMHLTRALELYPDDLALHKQLLERYRLSGAYEDYLRTLNHLKRSEPSEQKWNTRLQAALRSRREYLPYRVGLEEDDYSRKAQRILIFDLKPDRNSLEHYREPALVSAFLESSLRAVSRWEAVPRDVRSGLQRRLPGDAMFLFYDPSVPGLLSGMGESNVDALLEGSYDLRQSSLRIRLTLRNRDGIVTGSFADDAMPADVDLLAARVLTFLDQTIPLRSSLVDVNELILNVGKADGVKKEELFRSESDRDIIVKVEETSRYVSRISIVKGRSDRLGKDMLFTRVVRK